MSLSDDDFYMLDRRLSDCAESLQIQASQAVDQTMALEVIAETLFTIAALMAEREHSDDEFKGAIRENLVPMLKSYALGSVEARKDDPRRRNKAKKDGAA